jgi:secondary thiamine-phosphate synthase enzyme
MKQATREISVKTRGRGLVNINDEIISWVHAQGMTTGLLTVFIRHTSASLVVQENADPDVLRDLSAFLDRLVPDGDPQYRHSSEGDDDMPAHIRSALTQTQISVPLVKGRLTLGTWQDIYLFEHRTAPHRRQVVLHLSGE